MSHRTTWGALLVVCLIGALAVISPARARPPVPIEEIAALVSQVRSGSPGRRDSAAQRLYHLGDPRAAPLLLALLSDADVEVRVAGARAIAVVRPAGAEAALAALSRDRAARARAAAVRGLGTIGAGTAQANALRAASDRDPLVRSAAVAVLAKGGRSGRRALMALVRSGSRDVRLLATVALARSGRPEAIAFVARHVRGSRATTLRLVGARELVAAGDKRGLVVLGRLVTQRRKPLVAQQAARAIVRAARAGSRPAKRLLARLRRSSSRYTRKTIDHARTLEATSQAAQK